MTPMFVSAMALETSERRWLKRRMTKPQRHRLLHGYPLAAAMPQLAAGSEDQFPQHTPQAERGLLVGVLPHPFCNPKVQGCGFCTFPHQMFQARKSEAVVEAVVQEITQRTDQEPAWTDKRVSGLYFGGGTANLTPPEAFRRLCRTLRATFDLSQAEVTLEGVPAYFLNRRPLLIDILLEELPARHHRLSMGVQTFDLAMLEKMGRLAFGTPETFAEVVALAHRRGMTISADLLFNLPGQNLPEMKRDLEQAVGIGLDHLGLYHLVMFAGLGTEWSRDPALIASLPDNPKAAEHWLELRGLLQRNGFYQTTLTNFERTAFRGNADRFQYEEHSFQPHRYEMLGFGPSAITFTADRSFQSGLKTLNPDRAEDYIQRVQGNAQISDRRFAYQSHDQRIFYLTRRLAALEIDRAEYKSLFDADVLRDFPVQFEALFGENLMEATHGKIRPTARGMFYADSIAALLAENRLNQLRRITLEDRSGRHAVSPAEEVPLDNMNARGHM
jgi:oxygen-independent coproporphyrinogen-3 oxidase